MIPEAAPPAAVRSKLGHDSRPSRNSDTTPQIVLAGTDRSIRCPGIPSVAPDPKIVSAGTSVHLWLHGVQPAGFRRRRLHWKETAGHTSAGYPPQIHDRTCCQSFKMSKFGPHRIRRIVLFGHSGPRAACERTSMPTETGMRDLLLNIGGKDSDCLHQVSPCSTL